MVEKISACLVVYNEERFIKRCLDSLKGVADEIILVHDGECKDKTLEIAKAYGAKVYVRDHVGEAEPHRAFTFEKAKGPWIFQIDADEYLSSELKSNLRKLVNSKKYTDVAGFALKWDTFCYKNKHIYEPRLCLFRKNKLLPYNGIPHEQIRLEGNIVNLNLELVHKPKEDYFTLKSTLKKLKWAKIQADYLCKNNFVKGGAIFYFIKAFLWGGVYFCLNFIKYFNLRFAVYTSMYNFCVWWEVFKNKIKSGYLI